MKAIRYASLKKLEEFKKAGGVIVNIGKIPEATEKNGTNDVKISIMESLEWRDNFTLPTTINGEIFSFLQRMNC